QVWGGPAGMFSAYSRRYFHNDRVRPVIIGRISKPDVKVTVRSVARMTVGAFGPLQFYLQEIPDNLNGLRFFVLHDLHVSSWPLGAVLLAHSFGHLQLC